MIIGFVLFFLAGLGFGYAAPGGLKFLPVIFPLLLAIGALLKDGLQADILLKLVVALLITVGGIVLGAVLDARSRKQGEAAEAH
jgi:hypothetical protein